MEFPGGPGARTQCFQFGDPVSSPGQGTKIPQTTQPKQGCGQKKEKKKITSMCYFCNQIPSKGIKTKQTNIYVNINIKERKEERKNRKQGGRSVWCSQGHSGSHALEKNWLWTLHTAVVSLTCLPSALEDKRVYGHSCSPSPQTPCFGRQSGEQDKISIKEVTF